MPPSPKTRFTTLEPTVGMAQLRNEWCRDRCMKPLHQLTVRRRLPTVSTRVPAEGRLTTRRSQGAHDAAESLGRAARISALQRRSAPLHEPAPAREPFPARAPRL